MKINDISAQKYEGYVWLSNAEKPIILPNKEFDFSQYSEKSNPFIVKALLFNEGKSITIRHTGKYHINEFDLKNYSDENLIDVQYLPHRLDGVEKVKFKQLWLPEKDENCEDMEVLKMNALVFTGFEPKNKK